ncbi:NAD(P)-dependent alcohol dehydrogenase [Candidatus Nitrosacidococcus tergens]|uniref:Putative oxidoreductase, Zn-dependent and NAD(P)-binding n=1 Tax=Candidatus Nitrosacidococcus tergens TaxID=553981 RepID=A0A7G1Q9T8_9GAMM|nr:NAD(P)-dependent alcohol dehydrogenase [Candidatus Nitrosacidococcus tergens]CAB1276044.1 putative oxidoreductase, Zn-dependent and NAD(P)-binding [Candidatus Nitrosacidococcus tergens]
MPQIAAYAAQSADQPLVPHTIERRTPNSKDIAINIRYCGVCHSDLHMIRNEWGSWGETLYPCVPGHEIIGTVVAVGKEVTKFGVGDTVGVGCMVDSCGQCSPCQAGEENYCEQGFTLTYNSKDDYGHTFGGYSAHIVVDEQFVLSIAHKNNLAAVAPLLCAGITMYSPLRHWNVDSTKKIGIVGLGGLGHMGVKLAHAMGAHVVLFTTSPNKATEAKNLGADEVVISKDPGQMNAHAASLDFIINTVAVPHNLDNYLSLLKKDGILCLVGIPTTPHPSSHVFNLVAKRRAIVGSLIGGIKETQEMLDFCAKHNIVSDIEIIPMKDINQAYERMLNNDVKYRFVIDMQTLRDER